MNFRPVLLSLLLAAALGGCSTLDSINPFASTAKVKMAELDTIKPSVNVMSLWQGKVGKAEDYVFTPAVVDSSVYAAAQNGNITRFDDGKQVWQVSAGQTLSGGVGSDGRLVVVGTPKGEVIAFDAKDGKQLWKSRASADVLAAPAVTADLVVVRSGDNRLYGFDTTDGKRKWVYQRSNPALSLRNAAPPVISERYAFAGFPGGKLVAVSTQNGAVVWEGTVALPKGTTELDRVADITSPPVIDGPQVCAVAYQGRVACFDLTNGNLIWARDMSSAAGLAMDNRNIYVADDKGAVHALDRFRGTSLWKQDKLFLRQLTAPRVARGLVAVADVKGVVHFLNREDGSFSARFTTDGSPVVAAPQTYGSGWVFQTLGGGIFALDVQ
ncbi:MAG TPA: outer membrane protein assembly factor BamB [Azospira sp.]|nr:outer membrane protein assembly factor BamB [Azospira sp.]